MKLANGTLAALLVASSAIAGEDTAIEDEIRLLRQRLDQLERQVQNQSQRLREQETIIDRQQEQLAQRQVTMTEPSWSDRITISGVVEVEASSARGYDGEDSSDITLATVELGVDAQITDWVGAHVLLLHEEDDTDLEVDEGFISFGNAEQSPWSLVAGQFYQPFGNFESHMISDPLTLEIGETRESGIQVGFEQGGLRAALSVFNGDSNDGDDDKVENAVLAAGYLWEGEGVSVDLGASYITSIGDSDTLQDSLGSADSLKDYVPGVGVYAVINAGPWAFIAEYLGATDAFEVDELPFGNGGAEPSAYNVELGYNFELGGKAAVVAVAVQGSDEALALELPEQRFLATLSLAIAENTALSFEFAHDKDYDEHDGGTGDDANTFTAQLAVEF
ncbi:MAG: LbtU family siderophore porin [Chromatiales bacterium]|nr:LbtU family siderophore porin [Chromatiales bacterium]